jgi:glycolate oxidase FAD binding subunit
MTANQPPSAPPIASTAIAEQLQAPCSYAIDGRVPDFVASPDSEDACADLIRWAARERVALVPVGGGTELQTGNLLQADAWCAVSTVGLTGIVDYSPADLTVVARAGTTIAELNAVLGESGQWLPYDVQDPDHATIGGLLATNRQRLLRSAFGAPRDRALGLRIVLANGTMVRAGGRTVKNVAGYDLTKLFAGSRGTLGLITEVTIRTAAVPPVHEMLTYRLPSVRAASSAALALVSARLDVLTLAATGGASPAVHVSLAGNAERVAWQRCVIGETLAAHGLVAVDASAGDPYAVVSACAVRARCVVRAGDVPVFMERIDLAGAMVIADAAAGVVDVGFPGECCQTALRQELQDVLPGDGWLVWKRVPPAVKAECDVWYPLPGDTGVMRAIKRALDPDRVFSPGRFAGRL